MATTPIPVPPAVPQPSAAIIVAVPSDPASAAAFAAGNLFCFLCTPAGQQVAADARAAALTLGKAVEGIAQDVVNVFRGIKL